MRLSDVRPTPCSAYEIMFANNASIRVGCQVDSPIECEYECQGCQNYYEVKDMGATYPHCKLKLRKREGCVGFRPTELYAMAMFIE